MVSSSLVWAVSLGGPDGADNSIVRPFDRDWWSFGGEKKFAQFLTEVRVYRRVWYLK